MTCGGDVREGKVEDISEGSALVVFLEKVEPAMTSSLDTLNWGRSEESSGLVAEAEINYASVVYLPMFFIHEFISGNTGFLSCTRKVLGGSEKHNSQNLLPGLCSRGG